MHGAEIPAHYCIPLHQNAKAVGPEAFDRALFAHKIVIHSTVVPPVMLFLRLCNFKMGSKRFEILEAPTKGELISEQI